MTTPTPTPRPLRAAALLVGLATACHSTPEVPILLWHSVGEGSTADFQEVSPEEFEAELALLESYGATPVTLAQLFDARDGKGTLPPRPVVLTFDDNQQCLYDHVLPVLIKHHFVAELFLVSGYLAETEAERQHRPVARGDLVHPRLLSSEIESMQASGAFVVEAHSQTHRPLPEISTDEQRRELTESRAILQQRFHAPVSFFAYPYGDNTWLTRRLTDQAGYRGAVAVDEGWTGPYSLHRLNLRRDELERLSALLKLSYGSPARSAP